MTKVVIDDEHYIPLRAVQIAVLDGKPVTNWTCLYDRTKKFWNIQVSHVDIDTKEFVGVDGRRLKIKNATHKAPQ